MSSSGQYLKLRLFLEGREVPVVGAQIQASIGAPASANIQVIPDDRGAELHPRTLVHLFYRDLETAVTRNEQFLDGDPETNVDPEGHSTSQQYRLIFVGEVVGFQIMKSPQGRSLVLNCMDTSTYWDSSFQYMMTYGTTGNGIWGNPSKFMGAETTLFDDLPGGDFTSVVGDMVSNGRPRTPGLHNVDGLLAGVLRMLEVVGGVRDKTIGMNDYNSVAELRVKNMYQVAAEEGNNAGELVDRVSFAKWIEGDLGNLGERVSVRDLINLVNSYIYHDFCPNPAPMYTLGRRKTYVVTLLQPVESYYRISGEFDEERSGGRLHKGVDYAVVVGTPVLASAGGIVTSGSSEGPRGKWVEIEHGDGIVTEYFHLSSIEVASGVVGAGGVIGLSGNTGRSEGPHLHFGVKQDGEYIDPLRAIGSGISDEVAEVDETLSDAEKRSEARLLTQILRPDAWFVAPPRCNVFFPEAYSRLDYKRNFLREISRAQLRTNITLIEGTNNQETLPSSLRDIFYAPVVDDDRYRDAFLTTTEMEVVTILPHERFTGIIPRQYRMGDLNFYGSKATERSKEAQGMGSEFEDFARNTVEFNFFRDRFAARGMSLSGPFNPFPVLGFPGLVLQGAAYPSDKMSTKQLLSVVNSGKGGLNRGDDQLPTQLLGMITSLSHTLDQSGGLTSVTFSHVRAHDTLDGADDEFLNVAREVIRKGDAGPEWTPPVEWILMPPWFSRNYENPRIGEHIYQQFYGTGSIVDEQVYQRRVWDAEEKKSRIKTVGRLEGDVVVSVAQGVDALSVIYGDLKYRGLSVHKFIHRYTFRPIATMYEVFGSSDFKYDSSGKVSQGEEGFHSAAIANLDGLKALAAEPSRRYARTEGPDAEPVALDPSMDVRLARQAAVDRYRKSLRRGKAYPG